MSSLGYYGGLGAGATPESLAAQGLEAERQAKTFRAMGPAYAVQANQFQTQADNLYAAAKALHAKQQAAPGAASAPTTPVPSAQAAADAAAIKAAADYAKRQSYQQPTPSAPPVQLPTFTLPQRGPFGSGFTPADSPITDLFFGPQQQPSMAIGGMPTWVWVAAGAGVAGLLAAALIKTSKKKAKAGS